VSWDDAIALESVRWTQNQAAPGEPLLLDLNWQVLHAPQGGRSVWLELATVTAACGSRPSLY